MRILFFINKLYGGGAEHVASIILNHFCENHETYVAVTNFKATFYPIDNRVHIIDDRIKSKIKGATRIPRFIKMAHTIKKINPDIVISFLVNTNNNALVANLLCWKKIIVSERIALSHEPSFKQRFLRKILYPIANKIVFVSDEDRKTFGYPNKSLIIYNPSTLAPYANYNNRQKSIITIGPTKRWSQKGFDILINAWAKISKQNPGWYLEILGRYNSDELPDCINQTKQEKVTWLGWSANTADILRTKSIFVLASRFEGCPNSLIEAMSQGCACIGTNCKGGIKEIISNGIDGLIAESENVDDLAEKLQTLINDEDLRHRLSSGAIEKVKQFDINVFFAKWDKLIEEVIRK